MPILVFSCICPDGSLQECSYGCQDLESCLEALTTFAGLGWQFTKIMLIENRQSISLPVEAFDGESISTPLEALRREWEQILA